MTYFIKPLQMLNMASLFIQLNSLPCSLKGAYTVTIVRLQQVISLIYALLLTSCLKVLILILYFRSLRFY